MKQGSRVSRVRIVMDVVLSSTAVLAVSLLLGMADGDLDRANLITSLGLALGWAGGRVGIHALAARYAVTGGK